MTKQELQEICRDAAALEELWRDVAPDRFDADKHQAYLDAEKGGLMLDILFQAANRVRSAATGPKRAI